MKATLVSFALAIVLCGQAVAQEPPAPPGGPDQGPPSSMMNPPAPGPPRHARRRGNKMVEGSRSRAETTCQ